MNLEQGILALQENLQEEIELAAPLNLSGINRFCVALKQNRRVRRLSLRGCAVRAPAVVALVMALENNQTLEHLDLSCNEIGASGLKSLLTALTLSRGQNRLEVGLALRTLQLDNIDLDDSSVSILGMVGLASPLRRLSLRGNRLGDKAAMALATCLPGHSCIEELDLRDNNIQEGMDHLLGLLRRIPERKLAIHLQGNPGTPWQQDSIDRQQMDRSTRKQANQPHAPYLNTIGVGAGQSARRYFAEVVDPEHEGWRMAPGLPQNGIVGRQSAPSGRNVNLLNNYVSSQLQASMSLPQTPDSGATSMSFALHANDLAEREQRCHCGVTSMHTEAGAQQLVALNDAMKTRCVELSELEEHLRAGAVRLANGEALLLRKLDENADLQAVLKAKNQKADNLMAELEDALCEVEKRALEPGDINSGARERHIAERELYVEAQKEKIRVARRQMAERDQKSEAIQEELQQLMQEMRLMQERNQGAKDNVNHDHEAKDSVTRILSSLEDFLASQDVDFGAHQGSPQRIKYESDDESERMLERARQVEKSLEVWMKEQAARKAKMEAEKRQLAALQSSLSVQQASVEQRRREAAARDIQVRDVLAEHHSELLFQHDVLKQMMTEFSGHWEQLHSQQERLKIPNADVKTKLDALAAAQEELSSREAACQAKERLMEAKEQALLSTQKMLAEHDLTLRSWQEDIDTRQGELEASEEALAGRLQAIEEMEAESVQDVRDVLPSPSAERRRAADLAADESRRQRIAELEAREQALASRELQLEKQDDEYAERRRQLLHGEAALAQKGQELSYAQTLANDEKERQRASKLEEKEAELCLRESEIEEREHAVRTLEQEMQKQLIEVGKMQGQVEQREEQVNRQVEEVQQMAAEVNEKGASVGHVEARIKDLEEEVRNAAWQRSEIEQSLAEAERRLAECNTEPEVDTKRLEGLEARERAMESAEQAMRVRELRCEALREREHSVHEREMAVVELERRVAQKTREMEQRDEQFEEKEALLKERTRMAEEIEKKEQILLDQGAALDEKIRDLETREMEVDRKLQTVDQNGREVDARVKECSVNEARVAKRELHVEEKQAEFGKRLEKAEAEEKRVADGMLELAARAEDLHQRERRVLDKEAAIAGSERQVAEQAADVQRRQTEFQQAEDALAARCESMTKSEVQIEETENDLERTQAEIRKLVKDLHEKKVAIARREKELEAGEEKLRAREKEQEHREEELRSLHSLAERYANALEIKKREVAMQELQMQLKSAELGLKA